MSTFVLEGGAGDVGVSYPVPFARPGEGTGPYRESSRAATLALGLPPFNELDLQLRPQCPLTGGTPRFTPDYPTSLPDAEFVHICVGSLSTPSGTAAPSAIPEWVYPIARHATGHTVLANTLPVGSVAFVADISVEYRPPGVTLDAGPDTELLR